MTFTASDFGHYQTPERMAAKNQWMPPIPKGARVLDVGCDHGYFAFQAAERGAACVLGIDRGRKVRGQGFVDLASRNNAMAKATGCDNIEFRNFHLGKQWEDLGEFDHILVCSVYHHVYEACGGDHRPIWYWLRRQCSDSAIVVFEAPVDTSDPVVRLNVSPQYHDGYTLDAIRAAAERYFTIEELGPAVHEPTRFAFRMAAKSLRAELIKAKVVAGAGGATKAFLHANGRRIKEIFDATGVEPFPGSLNLRLDRPFDWSHGYLRVELMDARDRSEGFNGEWWPRWAKIVSCQYDNHDCFALRFEEEKYALDFVELIADIKLRSETRPAAMLLREV